MPALPDHFCCRVQLISYYQKTRSFVTRSLDRFFHKPHVAIRLCIQVWFSHLSLCPRNPGLLELLPLNVLMAKPTIRDKELLRSLGVLATSSTKITPSSLETVQSFIKTCC